MEVFAVATGGMAVLSLSIQLIQSIGTIQTFIRNVEDAPDELVRLGKKLEGLKALLEDVRSVIERQSSLQGQHFPAPSMTIFSCLQSCEESLQPLQDLMAKYQKPQTHANSTMVRVARWKNDLSISFKAKDIGGFEVRIQQEINNLQAALGVNMTSIMTSVFPVFLQNQQSLMITHLPSPKTFSTTQNSSAIAKGRQNTPSSMRVSRRTYRVPSALERFGLYQRKSIRYTGSSNERAIQRSQSCREEIISEEHEYIWYWKFLGYGRIWSKQRSYGNIIPSLSVYPVIEEFDSSVMGVVKYGTVQELQLMFTSGTLHPYTRGSDGESLLHVAAQYRRADICHLLSEYGLKPDLTHHGWSPFLYSLFFAIPNERSQVEIFRALVLHLDPIDNFDDSKPLWKNRMLFYSLDLDSIQWLWINIVEVFSVTDVQKFRLLLFNELVAKYANHIYDEESITQLLVTLMDPGILKTYLEEPNNLFLWLFGFHDSSFDSRRVGNVFINLLVRLGLDVETCVRKELECLPGGILKGWRLNRRIVFENHEERGWILEWEWVFDDQAPGYPVVSEYPAITIEGIGGYEWPFWDYSSAYYAYKFNETGEIVCFPWDEYDRRLQNEQPRFDRRMASKARKERSRTGQKRPRSRMPGAWI